MPRSKRPDAGPPSPDLPNATRASVRYDYTALKGLGQWKTVILTPNQAIATYHDTQAQAYAFIGLPGGRRSPAPPPAHSSGLKVIDPAKKGKKK